MAVLSSGGQFDVGWGVELAMAAADVEGWGDVSVRKRLLRFFIIFPLAAGC